jgi:hypothetical protein
MPNQTKDEQHGSFTSSGIPGLYSVAAATVKIGNC